MHLLTSKARPSAFTLGVEELRALDTCIVLSAFGCLRHVDVSRPYAVGLVRLNLRSRACWECDAACSVSIPADRGINGGVSEALVFYVGRSSGTHSRLSLVLTLRKSWAKRSQRSGMSS